MCELEFVQIRRIVEPKLDSKSEKDFSMVLL
jgi:hypothetical protein